MLSFLYFLQLSPKARLRASPGVKAKSATVTTRSPNESQRIATAKSLLIGETGTKTGGAAVWNRCPTDATVKTALVV